MKRIMIIFLFLCTVHLAKAQKEQTTSVTFQVVGADSLLLPNSNVRLIGGNGQVFYKTTGEFTVVLSAESDTVLISHLNYQQRKIPIARGGTFPSKVFLLAAGATEIKEVYVNTGYQNVSVEKMTGSFEKIGKETIERSVGLNILDRLEGVSSLNFNNRSSGKSMSIRGRSTIMANSSPLIILDNFPYDGDIRNINPNDIEEVTFLKDAAAASIWGVRASNGVIVLTTKKGEYEKPTRINLTSNFTIGARPDLYYASTLSSADFIELEEVLFEHGFYNAMLSNVRQPVISPVVELLAKQRDGLISSAEVASQIEQMKSVDVREDLNMYFYQSRIDRQLALSLSGGTKSFNYVVSGGWNKNDEHLKRNGLGRINLRSENSYIPIKGLQLQAGLAYTQINIQNNNLGFQEIRSSPKSFYPYASLADENGVSLPIPYEYRLAYIDTLGSGELLDWKYRPIDELNMSDNTSSQKNIRINTGIQYKMDNGIRIDLKYLYEQQFGDSRDYKSPNSFDSRNWVNLFSEPTGSGLEYNVPQGGFIDLRSTSLRTQVGRGQVSYDKSWLSRHQISLISGVEVKETRSLYDRSRTYGYDAETITYSNVNFKDLLPTYKNLRGNLRIPNIVDFGDNLLRYTSFYGNGAYTLDDKYIVSLSMRKDASNLFGVSANQKGVPLWSTGISWLISKEEFYKLNEKLPFLKLRMTYGYNGNVDNNLSALTTIRYASNTILSGLDHALVHSPGNPELRWEKSRVINLGVDFSIAKSRLSGSIDYYQRKGLDLIGDSPIDQTTGVLSPTSKFLYRGNVAEMKSHGIDLLLQGNIIQKKFSWDADLILNYSANKVTKYDNLSSARASSYVGYALLVSPFVNNSVYGIYSYQWAGLDPENGDPQGFLEGEVSKDYFAISSASPSSLLYHGPATPTVFSSLRNTFTYNKFSFSFNLMYKGGYYFRRSSIDYSSLYGTWTGMHEDYSKRWMKPGDEAITDVPSLPYPANSARDAFYNNSTLTVEKGAHIRLQDIRLAYEFSKSSKHFEKLSIYSYMNNLGILWKANKANLDPDYYSGGFPLPFTVSLGCNLTF